MAAVFLVASALVLQYGCASTAAPIQDHRGELFRLVEQPEIRVVYYPPVGLEAYRAKEPPPAMLGSIDPVMEGSRLRNRFALEDPALQVKNRILPVLAFEFGFKNISPVLYARSGDDIRQLKADFRDAALIDFRTLAWALGNLPAPLSYTGFFYAARARLVRLDLPKIVWEAQCAVRRKGRTVEQLEANPAVLLNEVLSEAAEACASELLTQLRGKVD